VRSHGVLRSRAERSTSACPMDVGRVRRSGADSNPMRTVSGIPLRRRRAQRPQAPRAAGVIEVAVAEHHDLDRSNVHTEAIDVGAG